MIYLTLNAMYVDHPKAIHKTIAEYSTPGSVCEEVKQCCNCLQYEYSSNFAAVCEFCHSEWCESCAENGCDNEPCCDEARREYYNVVTT